MIFSEALAAMHERKWVRRAGWDQEGPNSGFVMIIPEMQHIWRVLQKPTPNCGNYMPNIADLMADDWEVI